MSVFSIVLLVVAILLLIAYLFHNKIIRIAAIFTHLAFFSGFIGLLSILFFSKAFDQQVDKYLSKQYIGIQLQEADSTLDTINQSANKAQSFWDSISGNESKTEVENESNLYGSFLSFVSVSLQILIGLISMILMLFAVYFKYSFLGYMNVSRNEKRIRQIEKSLSNNY